MTYSPFAWPVRRASKVQQPHVQPDVVISVSG